MTAEKRMIIRRTITTVIRIEKHLILRLLFSSSLLCRIKNKGLTILRSLRFISGVIIYAIIKPSITGIHILKKRLKPFATFDP